MCNFFFPKFQHSPSRDRIPFFLPYPILRPRYLGDTSRQLLQTTSIAFHQRLLSYNRCYHLKSLQRLIHALASLNSSSIVVIEASAFHHDLIFYNKILRKLSLKKITLLPPTQSTIFGLAPPQPIANIIKDTKLLLNKCNTWHLKHIYKLANQVID